MKHFKKIIFNYIIYKIFLSKNYDYKIPSLSSNKTPKISIFLPIYNKGKYLISAIKSLQAQTLKEIEIIAINDGSTDNSLYILKKLAKKDIRIKIINNDRNYGTLYARAMGILNSTGEYIMNLDADDKLINDNSLNLLYHFVKSSKSDFARFLIKRIPSNYSERKEYNILNKIQLELDDLLITNKIISKQIFLKSFSFLKERIFKNKWIIHDDNIWNILVNIYSNKSIIFKKFVYYYKRNSGSLNCIRGTLVDIRSLVYRFEMILKININISQEDFVTYFKQIIDFYNSTIWGSPEIEIKNKLKRIIVHYFKFNKIDEKLRKDINFSLNKIYNNKIIIFHDSKDNYYINHLVYQKVFQFYKPQGIKRIITVNFEKIYEIINYIYPNDILIGINDVFNKKELEIIIKSFKNRRLNIFTKNEYNFIDI